MNGADSAGGRHIGLLLGLTGVNVLLQLASAYLLKTAPAVTRANLILLCVFFCAVLALNGARFLTWNAIHRRFPVSLAYPLSALFFPAVVALAWLLDEPVGAWQWAGVALIVAGVIRIVAGGNAAEQDIPGA